MSRFSPRLFVSYSRSDAAIVDRLVLALTEQGFQVFRDTSDIDPGDNFVNTLLAQIRRSTAIVAVLSESYSRSRWAQAELYMALTAGKIAIPVVLSTGSMTTLDEPVQRLVRDTQYVQISSDASTDVMSYSLVRLLAKARTRHRLALASRALAMALTATLVGLGLWWAVANLNIWQARRRLEEVVNQIVTAKTTFQHERIQGFAAALVGNQDAIGRFGYLMQDPTLSDVARFNALALGNTLRQGTRTYRWYPKQVDVDRAALDGAAFVETSFLGGAWTNSVIKDSTFAGVFWAREPGTSIAGTTFTNVSFYGGEFEAIKAIDVSFINSKFRGVVVDTTNFTKVRFLTQSTPTEGTPIITPAYALFERSLIVSRRDPPVPGVLDLTQVGDDVVFDDVLFVDCRLEGWFRPEWFRRSRFERCVFPASLTPESLRKVGNQVE